MARVERDGLERARAHASSIVEAAEQTVADKTSALEAARAEHIDRISAAADAGANVATAPAPGVRQARDDLVTAQDDLEVARSVFSQCETRLEPPLGEVPEHLTGYQRRLFIERLDPFAQHLADVDSAARAVIAEHGKGIVVEACVRARDAYLEAVRAGAVAVELARRVELVDDDVSQQLDRITADTSNIAPLVRVARNSIGKWDAWTVIANPHFANDEMRDAIIAQARSPWSDAYCNLLTNADAELPTL